MTKHVPQRTCLACREVKAKQELIRLVSIASGGVEIDSSGQKNGRGAYLCPTPECWQAGLKGGRLEHALRTTLTRDNLKQLTEYGEDLSKELVSGRGK